MTQAGYFVIAAVLAVLIGLYSHWKQPAPLEAKRHRGRVVYVIDGDTIILKGVEARLRLWDINAPEKGEAGHHDATATLEKLVLNKAITYTDEGRDRYGRIVARVFLGDGREANRLGTSKNPCSEGYRAEVGRTR